MTDRPFGSALERLREAGLRPTRQRLALCRKLFDGGDRHVTAEALHAEARTDGLLVSLATVYNTLHQFTEVGLLREVVVDGSKTYFDTNVSCHHHFYNVASGELSDIPGDEIEVLGLPEPPDGLSIDCVEIVVRVK